MSLFLFWRYFNKIKQLNWVVSGFFWGLVMLMTSCVTIKPLTSSPTNKITQGSTQNKQLKPEEWRPITAEEETQTWKYILNSPLGIAALNQLAIEGFISPNCPKTFYVSQKYGLFQTLLQVKCSSPKGISIATAYQEMRIILNRFEDNIESFEVERIYVSQ